VQVGDLDQFVGHLGHVLRPDAGGQVRLDLAKGRLRADLAVVDGE
jgi:hypothetical protein